MIDSEVHLNISDSKGLKNVLNILLQRLGYHCQRLLTDQNTSILLELSVGFTQPRRNFQEREREELRFSQGGGYQTRSIQHHPSGSYGRYLISLDRSKAHLRALPSSHAIPPFHRVFKHVRHPVLYIVVIHAQMTCIIHKH